MVILWPYTTCHNPVITIYEKMDPMCKKDPALAPDFRNQNNDRAMLHYTGGYTIQQRTCANQLCRVGT